MDTGPTVLAGKVTPHPICWVGRYSRERRCMVLSRTMVKGTAGVESSQAGARPIRVLFLGANPPSTVRLRIDLELRRIQEKLRASKHRSSVEIVVRLAARFADLRQALLD